MESHKYSNTCLIRRLNKQKAYLIGNRLQAQKYEAKINVKLTSNNLNLTQTWKRKQKKNKSIYCLLFRIVVPRKNTKIPH